MAAPPRRPPAPPQARRAPLRGAALASRPPITVPPASQGRSSRLPRVTAAGLARKGRPRPGEAGCGWPRRAPGNTRLLLRLLAGVAAGLAAPGGRSKWRSWPLGLRLEHGLALGLFLTALLGLQLVPSFKYHSVVRCEINVYGFQERRDRRFQIELALLLQLLELIMVRIHPQASLNYYIN